MPSENGEGGGRPSPVAVLECAAVRSLEARAFASGVAGAALMERAGAAVARRVHDRCPAGRVFVVCGPGGNGGDGYVVARRLADAGRRVTVYASSPPRHQDAAVMAGRWRGPVMDLSDLDAGRDGVLVDALFGAGLNRPLGGVFAEAVHRINNSGRLVVSVDAPSGLSGDSGVVSGEHVRADVSVTFHAFKPVHVLHPAAASCGEVHVEDIGLEAPEASAVLAWENSPVLWLGSIPTPRADGHKHDRGRLFVVTGGPGRTGAARLAARAGLRIGAGLSTLLAPPEAIPEVAAASTAVMTAPFEGPGDLLARTERAGAVVIGPATGVHSGTRELVEAMLAAGRPCIIDADAISVFAGDAEALGRCGLSGSVLTPHTGEFERLFPGLLASSATRLDAARQAAVRAGGVVVLKGADTVVAAPDGRAAVNRAKAPSLATAGSGDVLAGFIGGLVAQGAPPFEAACAAVWIHADIGTRLGPGLIAEDIERAAPETLVNLAGRIRPA